MGRKLASPGDQLAIPVDLVDILDGRQIQGDIGRRAGRRRNADVAAVPGKANITLVALRPPWLVGGELLPAGIVDLGRGPGGIVSEMKLPWAVKRRSAFTETVQNQGGRRGGGAGSACVTTEEVKIKTKICKQWVSPQRRNIAKE
jgi:hypothetical protein